MPAPPLRLPAAFLGAVLAAGLAAAAPVPHPWDNRTLTPARRAALAVRAMRTDEKLTLVLGYFSRASAAGIAPPAAALPGSAGYVPGIPRLGIPAQWQTDAGTGVATQANAGMVRARTALPSGIATAATWNADLAWRGGAMIGAEARSSGFNVMLAGGADLARDPRGGRTFEYAGEDPLLAGAIVGAEIGGIQSNHIIATTKHFALNDQETGRTVVSAEITHAAARESDLLAFQIAIERGRPGAVMCAYNRIGGVYACENDWLLNQVLKTDWRYPGYVLSDWGAVHSTAAAANAGLDQDSAAQAFDAQPYFAAPLQAALASGAVRPARLNDMVRRILQAEFATGVFDNPLAAPRDPTPAEHTADAAQSQAIAEQGIVLLKNTGGVLPLPDRTLRIAVIGGHADAGVLSGGGSSQVYPVGGSPVADSWGKGFPGPIVYDPSAPLRELAALLPKATLAYADGADPAAAAALAARSDVVLVFATQWSAESLDNSLSLPDGQDALIARVAAANPRCVVVLETGGPVLMPWLAHVAGVMEAWYPGTNGGRAVARVLTGAVDASGRLPITFPRAVEQLPRATLAGDTVQYDEGAAVGYKWFDRTHPVPLFPFGFGLSYGRVSYSDFFAHVTAGNLAVQFVAHNLSDRAVLAVPQIYVASGLFDDGVVKRLGGWQKIALAPHASQPVFVSIDPRMLANWDEASKSWRIEAGDYTAMLGTSAEDVVASGLVKMK